MGVAMNTLTEAVIVVVTAMTVIYNALRLALGL
jgi:hypothetical protein